MKATIHYNDGTETVFDEPEEAVRAHLKRADLRSIARIEIGDKELPDTCVALADLEELVTVGLRLSADNLGPDRKISSVSWKCMGYNVATYIKGRICNAKSKKS